ncbi:hypothetical protein JCM11491_001914 [Sporobolomyces phaffii]
MVKVTKTDIASNYHASRQLDRTDHTPPAPVRAEHVQRIERLPPRCRDRFASGQLQKVGTGQREREQASRNRLRMRSAAMKLDKMEQEKARLSREELEVIDVKVFDVLKKAPQPLVETSVYDEGDGDDQDKLPVPGKSVDLGVVSSSSYDALPSIEKVYSESKRSVSTVTVEAHLEQNPAEKDEVRSGIGGGGGRSPAVAVETEGNRSEWFNTSSNIAKAEIAGE